MPYFSIKKCPHCGEVIELGYEYKAFGSPTHKCHSCGQVIKLGHVNEWDYLGIMGKIGYILSALWTVLLYSVLPTIFLVEAKEFELVPTFAGIYFIIGVIYFTFFRREISRSKSRTQ